MKNNLLRCLHPQLRGPLECSSLNIVAEIVANKHETQPTNFCSKKSIQTVLLFNLQELDRYPFTQLNHNKFISSIVRIT